ncbi:MAG: hypothetical protein MJ151_03605, partial [Lachnospiraceae bacterium]|nr:hypothetical protein [Lachnospiraceae bacterium]
KCKVEIFSVPKLEKGQRQYLTAKKIDDLGYPEISIIDSGTPSKGTTGSEWQVFKVIKEGDKEIERIFDHSAKYVGHAPTAYEVDTYIDDDGKIQTSRFTGKIPKNVTTRSTEEGERQTTERRSTTRATTRRSTNRSTTRATTVQRETNMPMPLPVAPGQGGGGTPNAQAISPNQPIVTPY